MMQEALLPDAKICTLNVRGGDLFFFGFAISIVSSILYHLVAKCKPNGDDGKHEMHFCAALPVGINAVVLNGA